MSFGFGVVDFLTVLQLAKKIRKEFVDAPSQFKGVYDEVRSLSILLQDVEDRSERELTTQQKSDLHDIVNACRNVLGPLEKILDKYRELSSDAEGIGKRVKRVWKRLEWEPEEIQELRSRVSSNVALLDAFNGRLTRDSVVKLVQHQDDQYRRAIVEWLSPVNYATQQSDFTSRRQEGTGQWLLNSNEFQEWLSHSRQTLFCPGIPGAGKTMLTSIVVDYLSTKFRNDPRVGTAYIYCNFRRQQEQKPDDLLASLLKQLVQGCRSVPESVKSLYNRHKEKQTRPLFNEISGVLQSVIVLDYSTTFIIIDALDEYQVSDGGRRKFLSEMFNLQVETGANLFATSRFIPEIVKEFKGSISLEIRASDADVRRYLDGYISQLPSFVSRDRDLQEEVKTKIIKAVDGMFLLAKLYLDSLTGKISPKAIRTALERLPTGSKAYDPTYKEAMERIGGQIAGFQELATHVLSWITCAKRPLTTLELRYALAVEIGKSIFDKKNLPEIEDIVSVCAGLITVDKKSDIIRLAHHTTQEYLERNQKRWFPNAQTYIAKICITYLLFDASETSFRATDKEFEVHLQSNALYDYAARNWGYHARAASTEVDQLTLDLLGSKVKVSGCGRAMMASGNYSGYSQTVSRQMTGVHLAAYFGLKEAMMSLFKNGHGPNIMDSYGQTPLSWAAERGHEAVVELLLAEDGVNPDSKHTKCGRTPLSWAAENGHEVVVKLLLDIGRVDPDSKDSRGWTPLSWAAEKGHEAVVKLLLAKDNVDPDSKEEYGWTPLLRAAGNGHEAVVKLLLADDRVDPDSKDTEYGQTPLSWAAEKGHEGVVKMLLATDRVDPDSKEEDGRTPLSWAAENGHEAVVKLLLADDGVDPDSKDTEYGQTPLSWAAEKGHEGVVKLLLETGRVELDSKDSSGWTPLSWAACNGHKAVVKLLLGTGRVGPDSENSCGRTPLSRAAENGHEAVVKLLLATGRVEPDSKDSSEQTPLLWAAAKGHGMVVKLLLAKDVVDPNSKDIQYGQTPLSWAAWNGHKAVIELLLATGTVGPDSEDLYGRTPLSRAAGNGHEAVVALLLATGRVEPDSNDSFGQTPLLWAAGHGHEAVVKLLLARDGVDPDSQDTEYGQTPLSWAAKYGHNAVVNLLLTTGKVNPDSKDLSGRTPLSWAAQNGHEAVVMLLLETGRVDPDSRDSSGQTPLLLATVNGHKVIVRLLLKTGTIVSTEREYRTILQAAAYNGHNIPIQLLTTKGITMDTQSDVLEHSLQLGCIKGNIAVVEQLTYLSASPKRVDEHRWMPLLCASWFGQGRILDSLLAYGGDKDPLSQVNTIPPNSPSMMGKSTRLQLEEDSVVTPAKLSLWLWLVVRQRLMILVFWALRLVNDIGDTGRTFQMAWPGLLGLWGLASQIAFSVIGQKEERSLEE